MIQQNDECPWNVPVPLRKESFVPLFSEHAECNVSVDLSKIEAYGCRREARAAETLLQSDLQTNLCSHITNRLGSGRSGFYRGWYLKGVGRTPLAANWNSQDHLHNTGHLAASSAIREYVASVYLDELGCSDSIVSCVGLLLAELKPELRDFLEILYSNISGSALPQVDHYVQAITVKEGQFARWSNFIWLLHHLAPGGVDKGRTSLATFAELIVEALTPQDGAVPSHDELQPETIVDLLWETVMRACRNFRCWFSRGVWWGSFTNNLTIDGRFLDLELPTIMGGPFVGFLSTEGLMDEPAHESGSIGTELFYYLAQTKIACAEMARVLSKLPLGFDPIEREFAAELANEIYQKLLSPSCLVVSQPKAIDYVFKMFLAETDSASSIAQRELYRWLEYEYEANFGSEMGNKEMLKNVKSRDSHVEIADLPPFIPEPGLFCRHRAIQFAPDLVIVPSIQQRRLGRAVNEMISELDQTTTPESLLEKLTQVRRWMRTAINSS
jgi:hypothetical protein